MNFHHLPVLLHECLDGLNIRPDGVYLDCTLGGAGHSSEIIKRLNENGMLIGIDRDRNAIEAATARIKALNAPAKFVALRGNFHDAKKLMEQAGITVDDRPVIAATNCRAAETEAPAAAIELPDGSIITGKTSSLLGASAVMLLNALKALCGMPKEVMLISPEVIEPVQELKTGSLGNHNPRLHTDEVLIALCISAVHDENAKRAMEQLPRLRNCEAHSSVILSQVDMNVFKKLGLNLTCEPKHQSRKLYHA